jgi:hypothetical protein
VESCHRVPIGASAGKRHRSPSEFRHHCAPDSNSGAHARLRRLPMFQPGPQTPVGAGDDQARCAARSSIFDHPGTAPRQSSIPWPAPMAHNRICATFRGAIRNPDSAADERLDNLDLHRRKAYSINRLCANSFGVARAEKSGDRDRIRRRRSGTRGLEKLPLCATKRRALATRGRPGKQVGQGRCLRLVLPGITRSVSPF